MKTKMARVKVLERIVDKYAKEKNGKVAWLCARNKTIISGPLADLNKVTEDTPAIEEFSKARAELAKEFADRDADGAPKQELDQRTGQLRFSISRLGALSQAVDKLLVEKHPQAKIDQEEIDKKVRDLLDEEVDINFYRMELTKIPGYRHENDEDNGIIDSGDLAVLYELGIIYEKEEESNVVELDKVKKVSEDKSRAASDSQ